MTAYRSDLDALHQRRDTLRRELDALRAQLDAEPELRARAARIEAELTGLDAEQRKRSLPVLDDVRVASPCTMSWDAMTGDDKVRFCGKCEKNVFNLSAMTRGDAERLLLERAGNLCVRLYRRADGTVMTTDCPVGVRKKRIRNAAFAIAGTSLMALAATMFAKSGRCSRQLLPNDDSHMVGKMVMGDPTPEMGTPPAQTWTVGSSAPIQVPTAPNPRDKK